MSDESYIGRIEDINYKFVCQQTLWCDKFWNYEGLNQKSELYIEIVFYIYK